MPRKTTAAGTSQASTKETLEPITAISGVAAETFVRTCERCTNGAATVNTEVMSFINNRLSQDVDCGEAMINCENWAGILNVHQEWTRRAMQDYFAEAARLTQLAAKLTDETWQPVYEQTNQLLAELNKPRS